MKLCLLQEVSDLEDEAKCETKKRQREEAAAYEQKCHSRIVAMRAGKRPV